ncbi:MAG: hypothetical protein ABR567_13560 [Myxococcales bacterium]
MRPIVLLTVLLACSDPKQRDFTMPRSVEDVRGRLLPFVEGHHIDEARRFMVRHGFSCDEPLPSATEAHAHVCRTGQRTVVLLERNGRVADVQAR